MRTVPVFYVALELEGIPRALIVADSREDELSLRGWLRRTGALDALRDQLADLLDALDVLDAADGREGA